MSLGEKSVGVAGASIGAAAVPTFVRVLPALLESLAKIRRRIALLNESTEGVAQAETAAKDVPAPGSHLSHLHRIESMVEQIGAELDRLEKHV